MQQNLDLGSPRRPTFSHPRTQEEALCVLRPQTLGDGTRWPHKCQTSGPRLYGEPEGNWSTGANFSLKFSTRGEHQNPGSRFPGEAWRVPHCLHANAWCLLSRVTMALAASPLRLFPF